MSGTPPLERSRTAANGVVRPQPIAPSLLVSLAASPCLLAIVGLRATSELLASLGATSEEIFRGDRLPLVRFPSDDLA